MAGCCWARWCATRKSSAAMTSPRGGRCCTTRSSGWATARSATAGRSAARSRTLTPRPVRAEEAERRLKGGQVDEAAIKQASAAAVQGLHPTSDLHGSREYRVKLLQVMTERALTKAVHLATRRAA